MLCRDHFTQETPQRIADQIRGWGELRPESRYGGRVGSQPPIRARRRQAKPRQVQRDSPPGGGKTRSNCIPVCDGPTQTMDKDCQGPVSAIIPPMKGANRSLEVLRHR